MVNHKKKIYRRLGLLWWTCVFSRVLFSIEIPNAQNIISTYRQRLDKSISIFYETLRCKGMLGFSPLQKMHSRISYFNVRHPTQ